MAILNQINPASVTFIDGALPDTDTLIAGLAPGSAYYILDNTRDGLSQMADILSGYSGLDTIHLFSHGSSGSLQLGSSFVTQYTLDNYSAALATIGNSLSSTGDLLLYGCDVARGTQGQDFINALANATGADVAASKQRIPYRGEPRLSTLLRVLPCSSNLHIFTRSKCPEEREFYLRMATQNRWQVREAARQVV